MSNEDVVQFPTGDPDIATRSELESLEKRVQSRPPCPTYEPGDALWHDIQHQGAADDYARMHHLNERLNNAQQTIDDSGFNDLLPAHQVDFEAVKGAAQARLDNEFSQAQQRNHDHDITL